MTTVPIKLGRGGSDDTPGAELQQGSYPNGAIDEVQCYDGTDLSDKQIASIHSGMPGASNRSSAVGACWLPIWRVRVSTGARARSSGQTGALGPTG
ncbi:MAG: hypothetical protein WCH74_14075 [Chloroflexota bacterium]